GPARLRAAGGHRGAARPRAATGHLAAGRRASPGQAQRRARQGPDRDQRPARARDPPRPARRPLRPRGAGHVAAPGRDQVPGPAHLGTAAWHPNAGAGDRPLNFARAFNRDGTMMDCTFASIFIAQSDGIEMTLGTQFAMLATLMVPSRAWPACRALRWWSSPRH